jgi:hypothetical protein
MSAINKKKNHCTTRRIQIVRGRNKRMRLPNKVTITNLREIYLPEV